MTDTYTLPGVKVLLIGATGSGKTHSLVTLLEAGITPFVIFTENGMSTIGKVLKEKGLPEDAVKWHYVAPATQSFKSMISMAENINRMSFELLTKMTDANKSQCLQWVEVLRTCENFVDDRTGEEFGNVGHWGTNRCLVFDSLSGLNKMAMALVVGNRPTRSVSDWQVAQNNMLSFLDLICTDTPCHFVLTGHIEKEQDEVSGAMHIMVGTLGRKLAPKLPQNFDEVILAKHSGSVYQWSTQEDNVDLKHRLLAPSNQLIPSFVPVIKAWEEAGGIIKETVSSDAD